MKAPTHVIGFKARFVPLIITRAKRQTIRAPRRRPIYEGHRLRLQHGPRFGPKLIGFARAELQREIRVLREQDRIEFTGGSAWYSPADLDVFAVLDGFEDWADMRTFWRVEHPDTPEFTGELTRWGDTLELAA